MLRMTKWQIRYTCVKKYISNRWNTSSGQPIRNVFLGELLEKVQYFYNQKGKQKGFISAMGKSYNIDVDSIKKIVLQNIPLSQTLTGNQK